MKKSMFYILAGLLTLALAVPLIVDNSLFFPYITGKAFVFRIIVELALVPMLVLIALDRSYLPRRSPALLALIIFVGVIGVADIFGVDFFRSFWSNFERMEGYIGLLHLAAYAFMLMIVFQDARMRMFYLNTSLLVSIVVSIMGLTDLAHYFNTGAGSLRIDATFGNPIYLAIYGAFHAFLAALLALRASRKPLFLVFYFFAGGLSLLMLALTLTRGTVLGFFVGAMLSALLMVVFERDSRFFRTLALIVLIGGLTAAAGFFAIRHTEFAQQNPFLTRFATASLTDKTVSARFLVWGIALQGVVEHPLLGWGQENFATVFDKYYDPRMYDQEQWFDRTHNVILDWAIAGGILGLLAHLALFAAMLWMIWGGMRHREGFFGRIRTRLFGHHAEGRGEEPFTTSERTLLTGLIVAYFVHNLFVFDNLMSALLFFVLLAYIHARTTGPLTTSIPESDTEHLALTTVAPLALLGAACLVYAINIPGISTNHALIRGLSVDPAHGLSTENIAAYKRAASFDTLGRQEVTERIMQTASEPSLMTKLSQEDQASFITFSRNVVARELERTPENTRLLMLSAPFYRSHGDKESARANLETLIALAPNKQLFRYAIAQEDISDGRMDEALQQFTIARDLEPANPEAQQYYALGLALSGKGDEAAAYLAEHLGSRTALDDRFVKAYLNTKRYDLAEEALAFLITEQPKENPERYAMLASTYYALGKRNEAVATLEALKQQFPDTASHVDQWIGELRSGKNILSPSAASTPTPR